MLNEPNLVEVDGEQVPQGRKHYFSIPATESPFYQSLLTTGQVEGPWAAATQADSVSLGVHSWSIGTTATISPCVRLLKFDTNI